MRAPRLFAAASLALVAACTSAPSPHVRPGVPAAAPPHQRAEPRPSPTRLRVAVRLSPTPAPTPRPSPVAIPRKAPDAPPEIVAVQVNTTDVRSGDTLWGKVLTSSNVASVEVRVATYGVGLKKVGVGRFTLAYRLGDIPFFVRGTYPMRIIARNTRGDAVERSLALTIH